ncbi:MAG: MFS transporter, partial [Planctomycetes bacterium]|nr:MFS transporter [Planctomycetota bacterium]
LMAVGCLWALFWYRWFRDDPAEHPRIGPAELKFILEHRQQVAAVKQPDAIGQGGGGSLRAANWWGSGALWLVSLQYFCSNFTFFFCLTWLFPHLKSTYHLTGIQAGMYSAAPLVCGAIGNWVAGWLVDRIYRDGRWVLSRRVPAMLGFAMAAAGLVASARAETPMSSILWFSLAVFGADMTLAPSWSFCIDIGKQHAGVVSGTMNMAGTLGSFLTALAFPYLAKWTGSNAPFFFVAAGLNVLAVGVWLLLDPRRSLEEAL